MNLKRFIPGNSSKPADSKSEKKSAPADGKNAPLEPAKANAPASDKAAATQNAPAPAVKDSVKPPDKPPAQNLPQTADAPKTSSQAAASSTSSTVIKSDALPAQDKSASSVIAALAKPAEAKATETKPVESKPTDKTPAPAKEPPKDEVKPSLFATLFRGPTIEAKGRTSEPAKPAENKSVAAPASAPSTDAAKKSAEPEEKNVEPPPAPKPATWKSLPAMNDWCPPEIAKHFPELTSQTYSDCAAFDRVLASGWRIVGATRRGRDHANKGTHREDALAFAARGPLTVLCVSDGAGSCKFSRIGSHVASRKVTDALMTSLEKIEPVIADDKEKLLAHLKAKLTDAVIAACAALDEMAAKCGCSPKDFRCTLLTALHWRGEKHEAWLANQVGDGAVLVLRKDKSSQRIGTPDSGQHSGEVSVFVPDAEARKKAAVIELLTAPEEIECVLLCSDGIEDPFYPIGTKAAEIFKQFYSGVEKPLQDFKSQPAQPALIAQESAAWALAEWLEFEKRGEFDDRTALLMHRHPAAVNF